jgi:hypothetical protein
MDRRTTAWLASATALNFHGVARNRWFKPIERRVPQAVTKG